MGKESRVRIAEDGSIPVPRHVLERLGWGEGSTLEFECLDDTLTLRRIEVDPFREALETPDASRFDEILDAQKESQAEAFKTFEERLKDPPEVEPQDRPEFWG